MQERLLHFIWEYQYFDARNLYSDLGDKIQVLDPGNLNHDHGPDFLNAEILINKMRWKGHVELHTKPVFWQQHGHHRDPRYNNVILHVTWEKGEKIFRQDNSILPTITLQSRTPTRILKRYHSLVNGLPAIPCESRLRTVSDMSILTALDMAIRDRYRQKAGVVLKLWRNNTKDWEQTTFEWLARHFGFSINNDVFESLAASVPYKILSRHRDQLFQIEAMLFGMAGLLNRKGRQDAYYRNLKNEFGFLKYKYGLHPRLRGYEWKLLRLRPSNFPSVRIAQLASFIHQADGRIAEHVNSARAVANRNIQPYEFWQTHYDFGKKRKRGGGTMSAGSYRQLMMNTVIPLAWARSPYYPPMEKYGYRNAKCA
ncbi:MAG: DUF2851 family protein [Cyclobacteriaceae bacterium]